MSSYSPELIPECKETQLIRFQSRVVGLTTPARRHSMKIINLCLLISCIFSGLVGLAYLGFDPLVRSLILKKLVLSNTSDTFHIWEDPPISPHLKVYFFNLTNPDEVFNGVDKPRLVEVGPYTYKQKWLKQNITWHDNGTISYKTRKIFTFIQSESCPTCNDALDNVTTLNVPAISAFYQSRNAPFYTTWSLSGLVWGLGYKPWVTQTVHDLLWGYDEPLFKVAQKFLNDPPPFDRFGLFLLKNSSKESDLGMYSMYTGEGDPYTLSNIQSFNGNQQLKFWNSSDCNRVHGSDGASFNPYIKKEDTLWFFNDQLCRAMPLVYDRSISQEGLPGLRFIPRKDVFMSEKSFPSENSCFAGPNRETGDGVFDVTVCQFDTPIVLSWPHFLNAEEKYSKAIDGLKPDPEKHGFWFDIQDVTGTTLSAKARIQINMNVKKLKNFSHLSSINDTVIPILWFEEGIDKLGTDLINVLKQAATDPLQWRQYILYILIGLLSTLMLLSLVAVAKVLANRASVAKVERVREQVENILHGQIAANDSSAQLTQPMLGYLDSNESSRSSTATHSRTSSEGVTPPYVSVDQRDLTPFSDSDKHQVNFSNPEV